MFEAEVLILDELGAQKPTDWVWDTVALILNTRYNDKRTTLITTNYPNAPAALARNADRTIREETLGDRITERMRSRLAEMCVEVQYCAATICANPSRRPASADQMTLRSGRYIFGDAGPEQKDGNSLKPDGELDFLRSHQTREAKS